MYHADIVSIASLNHEMHPTIPVTVIRRNDTQLEGCLKYEWLKCLLLISQKNNTHHGMQ